MTTAFEVTDNHLLAALPKTELRHWLPLLERFDMPQGLVLCEPNRANRHVYFPTTAIISLLFTLEDGHSSEFAMVGNEGIVGISLFMGGDSTPGLAVVQTAGSGYRLDSGAFKEAFRRDAPTMQLMLRYTQALLTQTAQTAACNLHHPLDKQLCRWLLSSLDRLPSNQLATTHEWTAHLLGVRREGVTEATSRLQEAGLIRSTRGHIEILDRRGLEQRACECYAVIKSEYNRLLPELMAA